MAAIYSGIHQKLKSPQTPWEDKIKLARFAWISSQCLMPNKEQVLLDWGTHALCLWYNKKVEFPQNVLDGLWRYLNDILHSKKLYSFLKQGKSVSLRLNMAQLLLDRLQDHEQSGEVAAVNLSTLLSVCQGILSAPALSSVFTTKYELMVSLLARLILLACHHLQQLAESPKSTLHSESGHESNMDTSLGEPFCDQDPNDPPTDSCTYNSKSTENVVSTKLFEVLLQALTCYTTVQRQQTNPNRVFTLVTNQLFKPMICLRHLLTSDAQLPMSQQMSRDFRTKIETIFQLALFPPEHMSLYQEELTKVDSGKRSSGPAKGPLRPASVLLSKLAVPSICEPPLYYSVKSNTVSLLFKLFLESYGAAKGSRNEEQGMLCFYFLAFLSEALDVGLDFQKLFCQNEDDQKCPSLQSSPCLPESWSQALLSVESLLNNALIGDIYNVAADRIRHGEVQLRFYRAMAEMLLKESQPSIPAWYRCLRTLFSLNHLILEPDLEHLLSLAWVKDDCTDTRVLRAKQATLCSFLQTYTKLRQLPKFFTDLLSAISETTQDQPRPFLLSQEVAASLRTCLLDTPPSQTVEICSLVLQSFKKQMADEMSIDHDITFNADSSLKMLSLSQILHSVLFSLKTLDNSSPLPLVRQCQTFFKTMHEVIEELEQVLTKQEIQTKMPKKVKRPKVVDSETHIQFKQNALEAALLLRYTWVEMDTLFSMHCSKYSSPDPVHGINETEDQISSASTMLECILPGKTFPQSVVSSPLSTLLQRHILLQKMKKILLNPSMLANSNTAAVLNRAAHFIAAKEETENFLNSDQKWDGQMDTVNGSSYHVAHWNLVTSNLPLILPYLGEEDTQCIATVLVGSLLNNPSQDNNAQPDTNLTISLISSQVLKSQIFPELPSLFSVTVQFLLQSLNRILCAAEKDKCFAIFQKSARIHKEIVVECILASLTNGEACVELRKTETQDILNLLQIIETINTDGMSSEDLSACFLVLFFMLTSCQEKDVDGSEGASCSKLMNKLLQILNSLLEGASFPHVLKAIHGGTLLQAVVSSLLRRRISSTELQDWLDLVKEMQGFIKCLVQLIITRSSSVRLNLYQFASHLCSEEMKTKLREEASSEDTNCSAFMLTTHTLLAALSTFSQTLTSNLGKGKSLDELLTQILTQTTAMLGEAVELVLKPHAGVPKSSTLSQAFVVEVVSAMLQSELSLFSIEGDKQAQSFCHMALYQSTNQQILKEITSAPRPLEFLVTSMKFLSTFYSAVEKTAEKQEKTEKKDLDDLFMKILHCLRRLLTAHWINLSDLSALESVLQTLLCHLVENCSSERLNLLLLMIKEGLDIGKLRAGNYREVLTIVILIKLLFCCPLPQACFKALWLIAPQIISTMMFLVNDSSEDVSLNLSFTVPVVSAITTLLRQGEGVVTNPHHVIMVMTSLQCVPLERLSPAVYEATFTAIHEALFAIIKCHPQVVLKASPSFLSVFYRLVASIMQEGKQRKDGNTGPDSAVYLRCAMLVERMYSHIAATSENFTKMSAFIVSQYVTELQKVTLRPDIKLHLTEGIYMILDLCLEPDIKFLMAMLQAGVREVFNDLYSSYTHFHKAQRQGEEKYTV